MKASTLSFLARRMEMSAQEVMMRVAAGLSLAAALACSAGPSLSQPPPEDVRQQRQPIVVAGGARLWTGNDNHIPFCWHFTTGFPNQAEAGAAKEFVRRTIQEGWINLLNGIWSVSPAPGRLTALS